MGSGIPALHTRRVGPLAMLGVAATLLLAATAPAHAQAADWQCRASAYSASLSGNVPSEPVVANSGFSPCVDGRAGPQNASSSLGLPSAVVSAPTAAASTEIDGAAPASQTIGALGLIENLAIALPPGGGSLTLGVRAATARVSGACVSGTPTLAGAGEVSGLSLNGNELAADQLLSQLNAALAPLGQVAELTMNEQQRSGSTLTHRALHLRVLGAAGTPLLDVVAAEARGGAAGAVCQDTGSGGRGDRGDDSRLQVCPAGSVLDAPSGRCVIRVAGGGVARLIVVGRPFEGPAGGRVMALTEARKRYRSPCLKGKGRRYVVLGTGGTDRVTGTDRADRIMLLGGSDRGDGGRGEDCVDGGAGRDVVSGAQDRDRVFGGTGHDSLNGGPSRDRLSGGAGNDTINAAFGADLVLGGAGRDAINVATAGPRAKVSCGTGRDTVRLNASERSRARGCERRFVLPDKVLRRS
jgi:hypothetical protein